MQNALIKKKLEDQRENYRKRQEILPAPQLAMNSKGMQHLLALQMAPDNPANVLCSADISTDMQMNHQAARGPASPNSMSANKPMNQSPTPTLAFTPTSVLRKMTIASSGRSATVAPITHCGNAVYILQSVDTMIQLQPKRIWKWPARVAAV